MTKLQGKLGPLVLFGVVAIGAALLTPGTSPATAVDSGGLSMVKALQPEEVGDVHALAATPATVVHSCASVAIATGSLFGHIPLSLFGIDPLVVGDESALTFTTSPFRYGGGRWNRIAMTSNGYLEVGTTSAVSFANQTFPNATAPNNVLAPLWTDLNPAAARAMRVAELTNGSRNWLVFDWDAVGEFSTPVVNKHSFQVWIGTEDDGSPAEEVHFIYGPQTGNGDGGLLTVGAENQDGTSGQNYYVNGVGTLPVNGTELKVTSSGSPAAGFTVDNAAGTAPMNVAFDSSPSGDDVSIASYSWDFDDGSPVSTDANPTHTYAPGSYAPTLTVTDSAANTCSVTGALTVEPRPRISINDPTRLEGDSGVTKMVFRLDLDRPSANNVVKVHLATSNGTANAGSDYVARDFVFRVPKGQTRAWFAIDVKGDTAAEGNETFTVTLSSPQNALLDDPQGVARITNDD